MYKIIFLFCLILLSLNASADIIFHVFGADKEITTAAQNNLQSLVKKQKYNQREIRILLVQGRQQISHALTAYGYFESETRATMVQNQKNWIISYQVTPGSAVLIKKIDISIAGPGKDDRHFLRIIKKSALKLNQPLVYADYAGTKSALLNAANTLGYFDAKLLKAQVQVQLSKNQAMITLILNSGPRYRFGPLIISQTKSVFSPDFISRFSPFTTNEAYNNKLLQKLRINLNGSDYFADIRVTAIPNRKTHQVPVALHLKPEKQQKYTFGVGYGTSTGLRGLVGWTWRYLNPYGQHFNTQIQISKIYLRFIANYVIPGSDPLTESTNINVSQSFTTIAPYRANETIIGVDYLHPFGPWYASIGLHQYFIHVKAGDGDEHFERYLIPSANSQYINKKRTKGDYWQHGYTITFSVRGAVKHLLSDTSFLQGDINFLYSFNINSSTRLYSRLFFGATAVGDLNDLSPTLRYYAGGMDTIRGYAYKSLGPTNSHGDLVGGRYLAVASINLEHHLLGAFSGLLFFDIGNAFNHSDNFNAKKSAGIGVSYKSPIGPVRAYIAKGLDPTADGITFGLSVGSVL